MKTFNVGDKVSVLDDAIDGVVVSVKNNEVTIETSDKFLMTYFVNELIKINNSNELNNFNKSEALVKMKNDETPTRKQVELQKKLEKVERGVPEFDLHIEKLYRDYSKLSNTDIIKIQLMAFEKYFQKAKNMGIEKFYVIHGVGKGKLKEEIWKELDASADVLSYKNEYHHKYGYGATEVVIDYRSRLPSFNNAISSSMRLVRVSGRLALSIQRI